MRVSRALCLATLLGIPGAASAMTVFDPAQSAHAADQIRQAEKQLEELKQQLKTAQDQLKEATEIKEGLNQITNMSDLASALKDPSVTKFLPQNFGDYSGALNGLLKDNSDGFAEKYDHYSSSSPGDDFYQQELKRQKTETYADMSVGQAVYDAGGKRISALEALRDRLKTAKTPKESMDLQARISAESALLQNEVLRMQGLAMVQQARNRVDEQREKEEFHKISDEAKRAHR